MLKLGKNSFKKCSILIVMLIGWICGHLLAAHTQFTRFIYQNYLTITGLHYYFYKDYKNRIISLDKFAMLPSEKLRLLMGYDVIEIIIEGLTNSEEH